jgi:hypothetical protein
MSLDKSKIIGLVDGTGWNEFIELNRMAFSDALPRNSESRALGITFRMMRQLSPHIKWVISFADGTQSGDGAIYRAVGFVLTAIKRNTQNYELPTPDTIRTLPIYCEGDPRWMALVDYARHYRSVHTIFIQGGNRISNHQRLIKQLYYSLLGGKQSMNEFMQIIGGKAYKGFQLRYIYFIDPAYRKRLNGPELPFSEIEKCGAGMYRGKSISRAGGADSGTSDHQSEGGGASPTPALSAERVA